MRNKRIIALILVSIMLFTLVACSSNGGGTKDKPSPVGTYTLTGMENEGKATSEEDLKLLEELGLTVTAEFKDDGTGSINMFGEIMDFTWDDSNIVMDEATQAYEFDGTTLTMEENESKLIFVKDAE